MARAITLSFPTSTRSTHCARSGLVFRSDEKKLFDVIARAYLSAALMPDFRYRQTTATLDVRGFEFAPPVVSPSISAGAQHSPEWQPADEKGDEAAIAPAAAQR